MTRFDPSPAELRSVKDKVIVLTGGASGIGAACVELFNSKGAFVVFGDIDATSGEHYASQFDGKRVRFLKTDVTKYEDTLALFKLALKEYGRVDHAFSVAGIMEKGQVFEPDLTVESAETPPTTAVLDTNLTGTFYFTRIAAAYLSHNSQITDDKSITLLSSVAAFQAYPSIPTYSATKHGVLGLARALSQHFPSAFNIRVNTVLPHATSTSMIAPFEITFRQNSIPINSALDIANVILGLVAGSHDGGVVGSGGQRRKSTLEKEGPNGLAVVVVGGKGWDIEEGLKRTEGEWLGEEISGDLERTAAVFKAMSAGSKE